MNDVVSYLHQNLAQHFAVYFVPFYILGGRPAAIIGALLLGYGAWWVVPLVVALDTLQVPVFFYLLDHLARRPWLRRLRATAARRQERLQSTALGRWVQVAGAPGVVLITLLPLKGCGMLSGVLLSRLLGLPRRSGYPLLIAGSLLGCLLLAGVAEGLLELWHQWR